MSGSKSCGTFTRWKFYILRWELASPYHFLTLALVLFFFSVLPVGNPSKSYRQVSLPLRSLFCKWNITGSFNNSKFNMISIRYLSNHCLFLCTINMTIFNLMIINIVKFLSKMVMLMFTVINSDESYFHPTSYPTLLGVYEFESMSHFHFHIWAFMFYIL